MGIYVKGVDMPKENEILQIRIYGDGKVSRVYDIECQQIGTAIETTQVVPIEEVWANVQPLKDKILELEEKLYLQKTENEWIPVSERLPKEDARYLCQNSYGLMQVMRWANNLEEVDDFDFCDKKYGGWYEYDSEWGYCERKEVVAWQPLPKPYKEENEE